MENHYVDNTQKMVIRILECFLNELNGVVLEDSSNAAKECLDSCVRFVTHTVKGLLGEETMDTCSNSKSMAGNSYSSPSCDSDTNNDSNYTIGGDRLQVEKYQKLIDNINSKTERSNKIHHYFDVIDRRLRCSMTRTIMKSETAIVAMMNEYELKMLNLQNDLNVLETKIEENAEQNEMEKNNRTVKRNELKATKKDVIQAYDKEMIEKHEIVTDLTAKINLIDEEICQLQVSICRQKVQYDRVMAEKEEETERVWRKNLYEIQRKIAARKIQMNFRRYLNYIRTKERRTKIKGQHKKPVVSPKSINNA